MFMKRKKQKMAYPFNASAPLTISIISLGDCCLAGFVICQPKVFKHFGSIVGSLMHGGHSGSVFRSYRIKQYFIKLYLQSFGYDLQNNGFSYPVQIYNRPQFSFVLQFSPEV